MLHISLSSQAVSHNKTSHKLHNKMLVSTRGLIDFCHSSKYFITTHFFRGIISKFNNSAQFLSAFQKLNS